MPWLKHTVSKKHFFWQLAAAVIFLAIVLTLMSLDSKSQVLWAIGAGSLASSIFTVFTIPASIAAQPRRILGGYALAISVGLLAHFLLSKIFILFASHVDLGNTQIFWVSSAIVMGLVMVLMVLLDCQHPPAAGVALVLILGVQEYYTVAVILLTVIVLAFIRFYLKDYLINLAA